MLKANPIADADQLHSMLKPEEMRIDLVLGTQLFNKASPDVRRTFVQTQDYMATHNGDTRLSGLKIISYIGQKILKQCTSSWLTLQQDFTGRSPVNKVSDLYDEVNEILKLKEALSSQGQPVHEQYFFSVLHNCVSELITVPKLIVPLAMPIKECEKVYGYSGTHLLACLREMEFELTNSKLYKHEVVAGKGDKPVGAATPTTEEMPPGHRPQAKGRPCLNLRELGKCLLKHCKALHDECNFTNTPCDNPKYLEMSICPNAQNSCTSGKLCLSQHKKLAFEDYKKARDQALIKYPDEYAHLKYTPGEYKGKKRSGGAVRYQAVYATVPVGVEPMPTGVESISRPSLEENEIEATGVESISRPTFEESDFTKGVEGLMVPLPNQGGMLK